METWMLESSRSNGTLLKRDLPHHGEVDLGRVGEGREIKCRARYDETTVYAIRQRGPGDHPL